MRREVVVLACDWCDRSEGEVLVETHTVAVDGRPVEVEACEVDWQSVLEAFAVVAVKGRRVKEERKVKRPRPPKVESSPFPGTDWRFTNHALIRMGQRRINPIDVIAAADSPAFTHEGEEGDGVMVHQDRNGLRVVLDPTRRAILTAAVRDE